MILHATKGYCPPFTILDYSAQVFDTELDPALRTIVDDTDDEKLNVGATARATVNVRTMNIDDSDEVSD